MSSDDFTDFEPENILEGVSLEDLKTIPKVKALLERVVAGERAQAREVGIIEGRELGRSESLQKFQGIYEAEFEELLSKNMDEFLELKKALHQPVRALSEGVLSEYSEVVKRALSIVVTDSRIHDDKIREIMLSTIDTLPTNKRVVKVSVSSCANEKIIEMLKDTWKDVEVCEMSDLVRIHTVEGDFRFDPSELAENITESVLG